jgi:hypothetical protein
MPVSVDQHRENKNLPHSSVRKVRGKPVYPKHDLKINWKFLLLLSATLLCFVSATDCEKMNTWLPSKFSATGTECCSQTGITCVSDRITEMYFSKTNQFRTLNNQGLAGQIPSALGDLSYLTQLSLTRLSLHGTIPSSFGELSSLTHLYLFNNQLSGEIPSTLGNLFSLEYLYLSSYQLSGEIPASLGNLFSLKYFILSSNQLNGSIPSTLGNLSSLTQLYLDDNQLSGQVPSSLEDLPNLNYCGMLPNDICREASFIKCGTEIPGIFHSSY